MYGDDWKLGNDIYNILAEWQAHKKYEFFHLKYLTDQTI